MNNPGNSSNQLPFFKSLKIQKLLNTIVKTGSSLSVNGLYGSSKSFFVNELSRLSNNTILWVLDDKESAAYHMNDLENFIRKSSCIFFPESYKRLLEFEKIDSQNTFIRNEVIKKFSERNLPKIIVTYPAAIFEKVLKEQEVKNKSINLCEGDNISLEKLNATLFDLNFNRVEFVSQPGDFSVRGGIIDVFSFSNDFPYRIEFFGNEIESLRTFNLETQLSINQYDDIEILADLENKDLNESRESLLKVLNKNSFILFENVQHVENEFSKYFQKAKGFFKDKSDEILKNLFCEGIELESDLKNFKILEFSSDHKKQISFKTSMQLSFNKKFDLLFDNLDHFNKKKYSIKIYCSSEKQVSRLKQIFEDNSKKTNVKFISKPIYKGFINHEEKELCYTDHEIFDRFYKFNIKQGFSIKKRLQLNELNRLEIGDYVTHIDHGIGVFGGLKKIDVNGKFQEAIKLSYGDRDTLYLSIHLLHKICKYNAKDGTKPKIYKLGSGAWNKIKQKTKKRVKEVAFNLIEAYAQRKLKKGFQYGPDSSMQHELEASFIFEDTPDQIKSVQDVKNDMEGEMPMDRLVCGDVGFGKTEVAIRAAFKAIDNGKQVAVLVPTTVLAFQHYKTFSKRLNDYPVTLDYLNRFKSLKEKKIIQKDLKDAKIDLLIGTHQIVNDSMIFKNLGLLIVDEEQKFGVNVKEKIRSMKENVDVLTLSATPIPRTLQYSLISARDLSIINTPPPNRFPIESSVISFDEKIISDAINFEIQRGGQVFFIHNRIENINDMYALISRIVPNAEISIAHGKVNGKKLEKTMLDFIGGKFDILLSTTIVENGLDVPNANTIFINDAQNFGLSDLHQMRGRVGRSNKKAFCYFISKPYSSMTKEARKRIEAIEQHSELGSGFNIAMKDLEIRGAGDLLGADQSGFINEIGFETYQKILKEAVEDLKSKEFVDLFADSGKKENQILSFHLDTDFEVLFPDYYINNIEERFELYKRLNKITNKAQLNKFENNLKDRFGKLPKESNDLMKTIELKILGSSLNFEKIILKNKRMICQFITNKNDNFYKNGDFENMLKLIIENNSMCEIKEKKNQSSEKLVVIFKEVNTIKKAIEKLQIF
tara:strand:- start:322 stop:3639 length:3318 start_codon:yes stop_codon:yes gene_type:complete